MRINKEKIQKIMDLIKIVIGVSFLTIPTIFIPRELFIIMNDATLVSIPILYSALLVLGGLVILPQKIRQKAIFFFLGIAGFSICLIYIKYIGFNLLVFAGMVGAILCFLHPGEKRNNKRCIGHQRTMHRTPFIEG